MRVLIAEDDAASRRLLEGVLEKSGYEVVSTRDGNEAWEALQGDDAPRLVVLDRMMPGIDGIEICHRLREMDSADPFYVIVLTALGRTDEIVEGLEAGADDYVTKPFERRELEARLRAGERIIGLQSDLSQRVAELQNAVDHVQTLQGILPICMHCHRIKSDEDSWHRLEEYIEAHSDAQFSHALCQECLKKHYSEGI